MHSTRFTAMRWLGPDAGEKTLMGNASRILRGFCLAVGCALWAALVAPDAAAQGGPARSVFTEIEAALEKEIAARMVRRPQTTGEQLARMEIGIDLRLLCRSAASVAAAAQGDAQANARLRLRLFMDALNAIEDALSRQTDKLTPRQAEAAAKLRQMTFLEIKG